MPMLGVGLSSSLIRCGSRFNVMSTTPDAFWDVSDTASLSTAVDGSSVQTINDLSGNAKHATQATAGKRPLYRANSGQPYLEFDGVDDEYAYGTMTGAVSTIAVAARHIAGTGHRGLLCTASMSLFSNINVTNVWGGYNSTGVASSYSPTTDSVLIMVTRAANDVDLYTNANAKETKTNGTAYNARTPSIASNSGLQYGNIRFYAGAVWLRALSASEIASVKTAFGAKMGLSL